MEKKDPTAWNAEEKFQFCIAELILAKEKMTNEAILSKDSTKIKSALILLLESNKTLIAALDVAYRKLHDARLNITSESK